MSFSDATGTSRPRAVAGFLAFGLFLFSLVATAASVTADEAGRAARAWAARGKMFGAKLGTAVERVHSHTTTNGTSFYAAKMSDGGTVFLSSDTENAPIVAFTADERDFSTLDPKEPLWALLNRDFSIRGERARISLKKLPTPATTAEPSKNEQAWAALLSEADDDRTPNVALASAIRDASGVGDLRAGPLVKSKWSQSTANSKACYNYYTPNGTNKADFVEGATGNEVCGCVATSMSQVMRYHKYPTQSVKPATHDCAWGVAKGDNPTLTLTMKGGTYDWDSMTLVPSGASMTAANYQAIGKLTSDAGISVYMQYHMDGTRSSGAYSFDIVVALKEIWGYKSAVYFDWYYLNKGTLSDADRIAALRNSLFANFDAGYPTCMGIPGHSIVADGYGFNGNYDYIHLNMGWAGSSDFWYNLPDMTEAGSNYTAVDEIIYNVFPDKGTNCGVVSGRVTDGDGAAVQGASVEVWSGSTLAATVTTSASGVWGAAVPAATYTVIATSSDGKSTGRLEGIVLKAPDTYVYKPLGRQVPCIDYVEKLGNSWGNDITLVKTAPTFDVLEHPAFVPYTKVTRTAAGTTAEKVGACFTNGEEVVYSLLSERGRDYALGLDGLPAGDWVTGDGTPQLLKAPKLASGVYQVLVKPAE